MFLNGLEYELDDRFETRSEAEERQEELEDDGYLVEIDASKWGKEEEPYKVYKHKRSKF